MKICRYFIMKIFERWSVINFNGKRSIRLSIRMKQIVCFFVFIKNSTLLKIFWNFYLSKIKEKKYSYKINYRTKEINTMKEYWKKHYTFRYQSNKHIRKEKKNDNRVSDIHFDNISGAFWFYFATSFLSREYNQT